MVRKDGYDWLNDPFDEKKNVHEKIDSKTKAAFGLGCLVSVVLIVILLVAVVSGIANLAVSI
jgi:hypothetical protein